MNDSFLKRLRKLSVERCEQYFFPINHWSVLEWAGAAAGEAGETANVAKKIKRGDKNPWILKDQLADEIADTVIYLDLLCASEGIDLEDAIRHKFNKVSQEHGYEKEL
jgi:NTP pyrophosphatase (non-canonical NTP hydrolase)